MRLAEQGLLEDTWEPAGAIGRPPRHVYRLTTSGVAAARELVRGKRGVAGLKLSKVPSR